MWVLWVLACGTEPVTPVAEKGPEDASAEAVSHFPEALLPAKLDARPAVYVHEEAGPCADCHTAQAEDWRDSPHDLALGPAEAALGDFDGQVIDLEGLKARPFQEGDLRLVEVTDGAGTRRYKVLHTFGHDPLQQVLLEGDRGALWVAPIAWDVAGERWFDPSPEGVAADPADPLYWAGLFGTWNHMCASCHSTGVVEAYTPATASYQTTWTHEDVACEGCHGEGAEVQTLARGPEQVETCGACHSRRDPLSPGWKPGDPLLDHFTPALLDSEIYALDGGIQDDLEAFVWGSFSQSAMARAGVRCTHCHEPHGTGLVAEGNALCTTCHLARFDAVEHDRSQDCVACHMPESNYMGIDGRRDHRFGVPGRTSQPLTPTLLARARGGDPRAAPDLLAVAGDPGPGPSTRPAPWPFSGARHPRRSSPRYWRVSPTPVSSCAGRRWSCSPRGARARPCGRCWTIPFVRFALRQPGACSRPVHNRPPPRPPSVWKRSPRTCGLPCLPRLTSQRVT